MLGEFPKNPKYALIKWLGGADSGKYTSDVPTDWIKDFNYEEFVNTDPDDAESYVVEWHAGKEPSGGWPCYDGEVIQVSDHTAPLERLFKTLKGVASPSLQINKGAKTHMEPTPATNQTDSEAECSTKSDESSKTDSEEGDEEGEGIQTMAPKKEFSRVR